MMPLAVYSTLVILLVASVCAWVRRRGWAHALLGGAALLLLLAFATMHVGVAVIARKPGVGPGDVDDMMGLLLIRAVALPLLACLSASLGGLAVILGSLEQESGPAKAPPSE
jgi:heme A synthase